MNEIQIKQIKEYEKNTKIRRVIIISVLMTLAIMLPLGFYIFTVNETHSFKNLDKERYESRMNDSFSYAFVMLGCLLFLVSPFLIIINNMFKRYLEFIKTLSIDDTEKLILLNKKENLIYKYMPSYILKENTVTFFTMFRQNTLNFNDIISIEVKQVFYKGYRAYIVIRTIHDQYNYTLSGNSFKVRNLMIKAVTVNPRIFNNKNWN